MIEDQPAYYADISTTMKGFCQLHITSSAAIGLNLATANNYDLIMIDVNMHTDTSGLDTVQSITRGDSNGTIPIVAFSVGKIAADKDYLFSHGFTHIISEPLNIRNFAQQIKFILSSQLNSNYFSQILSDKKELVPKVIY
jgi:CheY-like chemotaxis protein